MARRGPQRGQDGLQYHQNIPTWLKIANNMPPRGPKMIARRFQVLSDTPRDPSKSPQSFKNQNASHDCCLLAVSLPTRF
eukprot:3719806-Pyramimonas_sp.AAC.1